MSKLTVSIKKGAAAHGAYLSREAAAAIASHLEMGYVIIPRADLPECKVIERNGEPHVDCGSDWGTWNVSNVDRMRTTALEYVGAWLTAEKWHAEQADAISARRTQLARELVKEYGYDYQYADEPLKLAIDRIIELERKAS